MTSKFSLEGKRALVTGGGSGIGLATYDSAYGLHPLDPVTEYTQVIVDGQAQPARPAGVILGLIVEQGDRAVGAAVSVVSSASALPHCVKGKLLVSTIVSTR